MEPELFTISTVARRLGVREQTVRLWERQQRIPPATRRNGVRIYTPADIAAIEARVFSRPDVERNEGETAA
jgi:DNA-binding transcriptional MerR regulator